MRDILIYTTYGCGACRAAGHYLEQHGISFRFKNLSKDPQAARELAAKTGNSMVPQVFVDGTYIGGYRELVALHRSGGL